MNGVTVVGFVEAEFVERHNQRIGIQQFFKMNEQTFGSEFQIAKVCIVVEHQKVLNIWAGVDNFKPCRANAFEPYPFFKGVRFAHLFGKFSTNGRVVV